jgi:GNAT superfamily N-acetyltransferase
LTPKIEKLRADHAIQAFDCGNQGLNRFLHQYALLNQTNGSASTYVGLADQEVIGYYSLAAGAVEYEHAPERITKGLAHHPVPIALLARLAVDQKWQKRGVGAGLLKDATLRIIQAADSLGIRALAVHAKEDTAKTFYEHFDFISSKVDPYLLMILLKDLRKAVS